MKCQHCGSENVSEPYTETVESDGYLDHLTTYEDVDVFDCLDCGELAQFVFLKD